MADCCINIGVLYLEHGVNSVEFLQHVLKTLDLLLYCSSLLKTLEHVQFSVNSIQGTLAFLLKLDCNCSRR